MEGGSLHGHLLDRFGLSNRHASQVYWKQNCCQKWSPDVPKLYLYLVKVSLFGADMCSFSLFASFPSIFQCLRFGEATPFIRTVWIRTFQEVKIV